MNLLETCGTLWSLGLSSQAPARILDASESLRPRPAAAAEEREYVLEDGGVAVIEASGFFLKRQIPEFSFSSTGILRRVYAALLDPEVAAILIIVDSPGGAAAGSVELSSTIRRLSHVGSKPILTHVSGRAEGAAYVLASAGQSVSATSISVIGGIGIRQTLLDESAALARQGIKVHVVSSGPFKGAGAPEVPIQKAHLAYFRRLIDAMAALLWQEVAGNRLLGEAARAEVRSGKSWIAAEAKLLGLVDHVGTEAAALRRARVAVAGGRRALQ